MTLPPVYVVSLARSTDRRESITRRLTAAGVQFELFDGVDGNLLDTALIADRLDLERCRKIHNRDMLPGELGCYLSHYGVWEKMVAEQTPYALVLEDQVEWQTDFFQVVSNVIKSKHYWNVVHLACHKKREIDTVLEAVGAYSTPRQLLRLKKPGEVTTAYLIDLDGAKKMLKTCYEIYQPIDERWLYYWEHKVAFYFVQPAPANRAAIESVIMGNRHWGRAKSLLQRKIDRFRRVLFSARKNRLRHKFHKAHPPALRK